MLLGILSDTHEHLENIEKAKKIFAERGASPVIHLGDYCAGPSVRAMKGMKVIGILGNNDGDPLRLQKNFQEIGNSEFRWDFCVLEFDGLKIACYPARYRKLPKRSFSVASMTSYFRGIRTNQHRRLPARR